jgi:UDP-GlcNAc:undecaprenyl-phosphate/decaprenyl-phosphate GlcNAc-1-phosphate transferase
VAGYSIVLAVAAVTTFLLTFVVRRAAVCIGAVSVPQGRSVHERATPTLGGAGMFGGFLVAMAVASQIPQFREMFDGATEPLGLMLAASIMFVVGAVDDLWERKGGVSPPAKVAGMVLSGSVLSLLGVTMLYFRVPFARYDGLAAGIVAIAGGAFFLYADRLFKAGLLEGSNIAPLVAIIAVGVCIGFLPHNLNPAKIIMGDAGALFLGLLMATTTITVGGRTADQFSGQTYFFFAPLFIPLVILGIPILDTVFSFFRRVYRRTAFHVADKDHLHHRLMRLGHTTRRTVVILWLWTALLSAVVLLPTYTNRGNAIVPLGVAALGLLLYVVFHPGVRSARDLKEAEAAGPGLGEEVVDLAARRQQQEERSGT